jgi:nitroreductase
VPRGDAAGMLKQFRKNYDFFDAPVGMILCVERRMGNGQWIDCGIFLDQLMLLAREKGLHTCPQAAVQPLPARRAPRAEDCPTTRS